MNSSHFYKKSTLTPILFTVSSSIAFIQVISGWYIESLLLSCSAIFYYILFIVFVRLRKKEGIIIFYPNTITIYKNDFSWSIFQKVEFFTRKNRNNQIEEQIHFIFDQEEVKIIPTHSIEAFEKRFFLDELQKFRNAFQENKEKEKKGYSLTPIEKKLNLSYSTEIKSFLEKQSSTNQLGIFTLLGQDFKWLNTHEQYHQQIINLSEKISKITSTIPNQVNSLVIGQSIKNSNEILFVSNINNEMRYGTENKVFYYNFNYPMFYPFQVTYNFKHLIQKLDNNLLLDIFQITDHELPTEKGILTIDEKTNQQENVWSFNFSIVKNRLRTQLMIISNFYIRENNITTLFQYETIFSNENSRHQNFFDNSNKNILSIIFKNLSLTNLKFAQQAWSQKGKNLENWEQCFICKEFNTVLLDALDNIKKEQN